MSQNKREDALVLDFLVNGHESSQPTLQWSLFSSRAPKKSLIKGEKLVKKVEAALERMKKTLASQNVVCTKSGTEKSLMICFKIFLRMSTPVLTKVSIDHLRLINLRSSIVFGRFLTQTPTVTHIKVKSYTYGLVQCVYMLQSFLQYKRFNGVEVLKINLITFTGWCVEQIAHLLQKVFKQDPSRPSVLMFSSLGSTQVFSVGRLFPNVFYSWLSTPEENLRFQERRVFKRYLLKHFNLLGGLDQL